MDKALISEALGYVDEQYIIEALGEDSCRAYGRSKEERNMNRRAVRKSGRIALVAAITALVLGITAGAVAFIRYERADEMMDNFAGGTDFMGGSAVGWEEYETVEIDGEERIQLSDLRLGWEKLSTDEALLEKLVYPYVADVDGSITFQDYTVTMEAALYDDDTRGCILYYTVENPNGVNWERSPQLGEIWLESFSYRVGTNLGGAVFVDEERSTDTKLYICEHFIVIDEWLEIDHLHSLGIGRSDSREDIDLRPYIAKWAESIDVPHTEFDGGNIIVTPFGMTFSKNGIGVDPGLNHQYIALLFDDGSEYVVYDRPNLFANEVCSGANGPMRDHWETHLFNSIIDINSVVEVQIDDAVFTLE